MHVTANCNFSKISFFRTESYLQFSITIIAFPSTESDGMDLHGELCVCVYVCVCVCVCMCVYVCMYVCVYTHTHTHTNTHTHTHTHCYCIPEYSAVRTRKKSVTVSFSQLIVSLLSPDFHLQSLQT